MTLVFDGPLVEWAAQRIPHAGDFGPAAAVGVQGDGRLIAVCVYHGLRYGTCEISMAADSPRWARKGIIRALLSVPFEQYGCHLVQTITPQDNIRAIRFNQGIGMKLEAKLRDRYAPGRAAVIASMTKDEFHARYGVPHGFQEQFAPARA